MIEKVEFVLFSLCVAAISAGWAWIFFQCFAAPRIARRARVQLRAEYLDVAKHFAREDEASPSVPAVAYGGPLDGHVFDIPPHIVRVVFNGRPDQRHHYALSFTGDPRTGRVFTYVQA